MVLLKNWSFFYLFFLNNIGQENVLYDILERKNAFLGNKNKKFTKSKNWHFSRGVNPSFWWKIGHFAIFFFWQYRPGKCVLWFSRTKNAFLGNKKKSAKSRKIDSFAKGLTHCFAQKLGISPSLFFREYRAGKCVLWYSRTKKRVSKQ